MNISDKLLAIAENQPTVYDAGFMRGRNTGYEVGTQEGYKHGYDIGRSDGNDEGFDRGYEDGHKAGITDGYEQGYAKGIPEGKRQEYNAFWDSVQANGTRTNWSFCFAGHSWNRITFKPKYDIIVGAYPQAMFRQCSIGDLKSILDEQGVKLIFEDSTTNIGTMFLGSGISHIPEIGNTMVTSMTTMCSDCTSLVSIERLIVSNTDNCNMSNAFKNCTGLQEIRFSENISPTSLNLQYSPLSHDSLMSLVNALADKSADTSTTWSITLGSDNIAKLTEDELLIMTNKGWTYS